MTSDLVTPRLSRLKITVSIGAVKFVIPLEAMTSQASTRPRVRKGNGQFAAPPSLDSLDAAPAATVNVVLVAIGGNEIEVIKAVRKIVRLGRKEAKDLVEDAPSIIVEEVSWSEAEWAKAVLESAGATVALQPYRSRGNGQYEPQHAEAGYGA